MTFSNSGLVLRTIGPFQLPSGFSHTFGYWQDGSVDGYLSGFWQILIFLRMATTIC